EHPNSYALIQGDVLANAMHDAAKASKLKVVKGSGIGAEAVLAVMNQRTWDRSQGNWAAVAQHASRVSIVTSSESSGPGATMRSLMTLDPDHLGKGNVRFLSSIDDAITAVANGTADVMLMVQFANPDNPRFKSISERGLHFAPVLMGAMRGLKFPDGSPAY